VNRRVRDELRNLRAPRDVDSAPHAFLTLPFGWPVSAGASPGELVRVSGVRPGVERTQAGAAGRISREGHEGRAAVIGTQTLAFVLPWHTPLPYGVALAVVLPILLLTILRLPRWMCGRRPDRRRVNTGR